MKVLSLFDGMSCGMIAFKNSNVPIERYVAYEVDKYAIQTSQHNFPEIEHKGDVFEADFTQYQDFDWVVGGSPCFTKGHLVLTDKGYKDISEIKLGDKVLTHEGRYKPVVRLYQREAIVSELSVMGYPKFTTTANHPFYTISRRKATYKEYLANHSWRRFTDKPEWKSVSQLSKNDFCGCHIMQSQNINDFNLDDETCWLLGRYLADGHIRKDKRKGRNNSYQYQVVLSIGSHKIREFQENILHRRYSCFLHSDNVHRAVFSSKELVEFITENGFGVGAYNKKIPEFIFNLPKRLQLKFLDGYLSGDGCYVKLSDEYNASTISFELALGLQRLITSLYHTNVGISVSDNNREHKINGRVIKANYPLYTVQFKHGLRKQTVAHIQDNILWTQVKSWRTTNREETVYNIEVADDNSYTVNNCIVHNCTYWSISQSPDKRETTASGIGWELFNQYARAIKEAKPKYFLYENNKSMSKDIKESISQTFGFEPIMINSALVSAQNRQRLYWVGIRQPDGTYRKANINQPEDRGILLKDILEGGGIVDAR